MLTFSRSQLVALNGSDVYQKIMTSRVKQRILAELGNEILPTIANRGKFVIEVANGVEHTQVKPFDGCTFSEPGVDVWMTIRLEPTTTMRLAFPEYDFPATVRRIETAPRKTLWQRFVAELKTMSQGVPYDGPRG